MTHKQAKKQKKKPCSPPVWQLGIINTPADRTLNRNLYYSTITTKLDQINHSRFDTDISRWFIYAPSLQYPMRFYFTIYQKIISRCLLFRNILFASDINHLSCLENLLMSRQGFIWGGGSQVWITFVPLPNTYLWMLNNNTHMIVMMGSLLHRHVQCQIACFVQQQWCSYNYDSYLADEHVQ